jgi:hypothetical protein
MNVRLDDVDITSKDGKTYNLNQVNLSYNALGLFKRRTD